MSTHLQIIMALNLLVLLVLLVALAIGLTEPAELLIATLKRHLRNAVLKQALIGRISWPKALPLLNWLEVRK